jgi:hypothetical protein
MKSPQSTETTPKKSNRRRKPATTKKVSVLAASDQSFENEGMDLEAELMTNIIACEPKTTTESDDCETIDKIAQMVSDLSQISSTSVHMIPSENQQQQAKLNKPNDEMIEDQLAQMFGEQANEATAAPEQTSQPTNEPIKVKKPRQRKKKVDGAPPAKKRKQSTSTDVTEKLKNGKPGVKKGRKPKEPATDGKTEVPKKKSKDKSRSLKADVAPFVQIQKDGTFSIVNQTANGDDDAEKSSNKTKKSQGVDRKNKAIRGLHVSTLSNKYDAEIRDATWVCVFCKLGPHKLKLGDLFGPYIISKTSEGYAHCLQDPANDIFRQSNKDKFVKQPPATPEKPKKKRKSNASPAAAVNGGVTFEEVFNGMSKIDDNNYEVWFHEDCISYASGVYMIGSKIVGMEAAIWSSTRYRCAYCHKNGAILSCLSRDCKKPAHFGCARKTWKLHDDFKTFCEAH